MDNKVIKILKQGTIKGNLLKLPSIQLEKKLYEPIPLWENKNTFYPPIFFVEIIE